MALQHLFGLRCLWWALVALAALGPSTGWAFARQKTASGKEVYWPRKASSTLVKYHIQKGSLGDYFAQNPALGDVGSEIFAIQSAFLTWAILNCPDGRPIGLRFQYQGQISSEQANVGYDDKCAACNTNLIVFVRDRNQWRHNESVLSKTTVSANPTTGEIQDADIEINASGAFPLSTQTENQENIKWDLQNIMTHEVGRLLGLDTSADPKATMAAKTSMGDLSLRTPEADDIQGACTIYPPNPNLSKIPTYKEVQAERALGCATMSPPSLPLLGGFLLLLALGLARARSFLQDRHL